MAADLDHLSHVKAESKRFRALLKDADPAAPVPTCPEWDAADLLWHLTEVQAFWARVVQQRPSHPRELQGDDLVRPGDHPALLALAEQSADDLVAALRRTPPQTPVWTWAEDHSVGFVLRRQAHEALVHRVDAECVVDQRTPLDPQLAADGVDEALRVMLGGAPEGTKLSVDAAATIRLRCTDTGHSWLVSLARFDGTDEHGSPSSGPTLVTAAQDHDLPTAATVAAAAGDLDCWLWGRPPLGEVNLAGDVRVLGRLREIIGSGIN